MARTDFKPLFMQDRRPIITTARGRRGSFLPLPPMPPLAGKTRGVPGRGSRYYGPRGQRVAFRNFGGMNGNMNGKGIQSYILGLVSVGVLFFVIGYGYQAGKEKA